MRRKVIFGKYKVGFVTLRDSLVLRHRFHRQFARIFQKRQTIGTDGCFQYFLGDEDPLHSLLRRQLLIHVEISMIILLI